MFFNFVGRQKRVIRWPGVCLSFVLALFVANSLSAMEDVSGGINWNQVVPDNIPFSVGEQIDYRVMFGIIPAGKARLAVVGVDTLNGQAAYHTVSTARSAKGYDLVFKVRDSVETWIDEDSVYSHFYRKNLKEGPYRDEKIVRFELASGRVFLWDDGVSKPPLIVPPRVQDVLSAGYKVRTLPLTVGDTMHVLTHDVNKTYDLMVIVHGRERVETDVGIYDCLKVEPILHSGGIFKKEKGARVFVWVTDDDLHIPVKMQSRVSFGSLTAIMDGYRPGCRQAKE